MSDLTAPANRARSGDDVWIPSTCALCYGKGVFFNELLDLDWDHVSPVNLGLDVCARVKVIPAES